MKRIGWLLLITQVFAQAGNSVIAGRLLDPEGKPAAGIRIALIPPKADGKLDPDTLLGITQTDASGQYRIEGVPPGRYGVVAGDVQFPTYFPGTAVVGEARIISVADGSNITGMDFSVSLTAEELRQRRAAEVTLEQLLAAIAAGIAPPAGGGWILGQVVFEGQIDLGIMVTLEYASNRPPGISGNDRSRLSADRSFQLQALPGPDIQARIGVMGRDRPELPDNYYLKSISLDADDLTNKAFTLSTTIVPRVRIVLGVGQQISGSLRQQNDQPAPNIGITFTPRAQQDRLRLTRTATTNQDGDFTVRGLAPGEYTVSTGIGNGELSVSVSEKQNAPLHLTLKSDQTLSVRRP